MTVQIKRIYDTPETTDGFRVLVDRLWPRGVSRKDARLDAWEKTLAPSTTLRKWFNHRQDRFEDFRTRYLKELAGKEDVRESLLQKSGNGTVTLLYAARDRTCNHAVILREFLESD